MNKSITVVIVYYVMGHTIKVHMKEIMAPKKLNIFLFI